MNELIKLPEDAHLYADFADFIADNEVAGTISETKSGKKHISREPGADIIGKRVVHFVKVREGGGRRPGSGTFAGWKKVDSGYVIEGAGSAYEASWANNALRCNYYVKGA